VEARVLELILFVRDLTEARGYYHDLLGLPVVYESDWYLSFAAGPSSFISCNGRRQDYREHGSGGRGVRVEIRVDDVDAVWRRLEAAGVPFEAPPEDMPWGLRSCISRDPEGYAVWISSPPDPLAVR
jgi:catechol 2,3-dioxygenase-like lactoylglutathione lyase family enzyme